MVVQDVLLRDAADGLAERARAEPDAVVVEEESVDSEAHLVRQRRLCLVLGALEVDPVGDLLFFGQRVAVDLVAAFRVVASAWRRQVWKTGKADLQ